MADTTNTPHHEIEADDLMSQIQEEVLRRFMTVPRSNYGDTPSMFDWPSINESIGIAQHHSDIGTKMLPLLGFHRGIRWIVKLAGRLILYLSKIVTIPQMFFNRSILQTVRTLRNGLQHVDNHLHHRENHLQHLDDRLQHLDDRLTMREGWIDEKFNEVDKSFETLDDRHNWTIKIFEELEKLITNNQSNQDRRLAEFENRLAGILEYTNEHERFVNEHKKTISYLKRDTVIQERRVGVLLEEARKRLPEPFSKDQLETFIQEDFHFLDALYISFEDRFRGTREEIKDKLTEYLPLLKKSGAGSTDRPVLDVGCGRGEWLELLREKNIIAKGLDINRTLVEQNLERGFDVIEGDVTEYLKTLPGGSLGAITGFHIVEHLPFATLIKLFDETIRVLHSGGIAIFETPNPENILVGACHFYADPTHRNPLPSYLLEFVAQYRGLCDVEILKLHPFPETLKVSGSELAERFNDYFYGPRDYAVIGYKS